jgi:glycosyltransferase involved in cell wall biosynthesis
MTFSIIIVAYKRYDAIKCLLYSILAQTYQNFNVLIIHDGEDQKHREICSEFLKDDRFRYIQTNVRYNDWGMSLRNICLDMVTGDFIINTNDDNYYTPNWLAEMATAIEREPDCNFVYYDMILSHNNIKNSNRKDYGLFKPRLQHSYIDMGQFAIRESTIHGHKFNLTAPADGELIEEIKHKLVPVYIDKVLFVHN